MTDRKEVLRYLGYKGQTPPQDIIDLIEVCVREAEEAAEPKHVMQRMQIQIEGEAVYVKNTSNTLLILRSQSLARNLAGCHEAVFFAATLGLGVDRLLQKYLKIQVSKAVVIQAVAAAMIEDYCDRCQMELAEACAKEGLTVRPRYSPGYGDLALAVQKEFLELLNANKTVGIVLTEGDIMLPEKSVTAIIGLRGNI